jgi:hypothetical protein
MVWSVIILMFLVFFIRKNYALLPRESKYQNPGCQGKKWVKSEKPVFEYCILLRKPKTVR